MGTDQALILTALALVLGALLGVAVALLLTASFGRGGDHRPGRKRRRHSPSGRGVDW